MVKLKSKIKTINSLPPEENKKISIFSILITIIMLIITLVTLYFLYKNFVPYFKAVKIEKIIGKKSNITECNTKDYIIIGKDKSYSLSLTDSNCITNYYEGTIIVKYNEIIFKDNLKGYIDNNYNIIINNNIFESDKNE